MEQENWDRDRKSHSCHGTNEKDEGVPVVLSLHCLYNSLRRLTQATEKHFVLQVVVVAVSFFKRRLQQCTIYILHVSLVDLVRVS